MEVVTNCNGYVLNDKIEIKRVENNMVETLVLEETEVDEVKPKKLTKIEKLIAPHSFQPEFKECLANIEREFGFELFKRM